MSAEKASAAMLDLSIGGRAEGCNRQFESTGASDRRPGWKAKAIVRAADETIRGELDDRRLLSDRTVRPIDMVGHGLAGA